MTTKAAVTGAFGYTGKYIARLLLANGQDVITLTGRPERGLPEFAGRIRALPFDFDQPERLCESLTGVDVLYNTYWVRFNYGSQTYERAVANTRTLIRAAREAGVRRIVHVSITNPTLESRLPYFHGKALLEQAVQDSGLEYTILRPTVIFGAEDILINNIAWLLRHFPVFAVPGSGEYRLQPIFVEDMAELAVRAGLSHDNEIIDAVGPDIFTFNELLALVAGSLKSKALRVHLPAGLALQLSRLIGVLLGDVVLTQDEVEGLSAGLLVSKSAPTGRTRLADWLAQNHAVVGMHYASELSRHYLSPEKTLR
jgi:NADH dehydrogenase